MLPEDSSTIVDGPWFRGVVSVADVIAERYELRGMLGAGGMGTVFSAYDRDLGELVALKILRRADEGAGDALELFRQEVRLARRVTHPNVARVFDIGIANDFTFLTMELVDGVSLASVASAPLDVGRVVEIALALCDALAAAHDAGVLHCDLKPANVLCAHDGRYVVTDFGIARVLNLSNASNEGGTRSATVIGTPPFMSPEQMAGEPLDEGTDVYALGVLLFRVLTGKLPWAARTVPTLVVARAAEPTPDPRLLRPDVPAPLAELVKRCLAQSRGARFPSIRHVAEGLRAAVVGHLPIATPRERVPIAVLPLETDADASDRSLAAGLVDEIAEHLAAAPELIVRPRALVERLATTTDDGSALARALHVGHAVTGELTRREGQLRLQLRLVSTADWRVLLALDLDFESAELLAIGQRAARHIALALAKPTTAPRATGEAADLFLRGRTMYRAFEDGTSLLARAHELAPAEARIAATYALALARRESEIGDAITHARAVADRAVALDPNLSDAHLAAGLIHLYDGDGRAAAVALRRAYALEPANVDVVGWMGRLLIEVGALQEGVALLERALSLAPAMPVAVEARSRAFALLGRYDEAVAALDEARDGLGPIHAFALSRIHLWHPSGAIDARLLDAANGEGMSPQGRDFLYMVVAVARGEPVSDAVLASHLLAFPAKGAPRRAAFDVQRRVELFCATGRLDAAVAALDRLGDHAFLDHSWLDGCPLLAPLRGCAELRRLRPPTMLRAARAREALLGG